MWKKALVYILGLVFLTGCTTQQTDYEMFVKQNEDIMQATNFILSYDTINQESQTIYEIGVDFSSKTVMINTNDLTAYIYGDYAYLYDNGQWVKSSLYNFDYFEIEKLLSNSYYQLNFPDPDEEITNFNSGIAPLDTLLNGLTPNDVVECIDDDLFTIIGMEDNLKINTTDNNLILSFNYPDNNKQVTITYATDTDTITVPDEAVSAEDVDATYNLNIEKDA